MGNNASRRFLEKLQSKVGQKVDQEQLRTLAGAINKADFEDEAKLRQLIKTLATLSGTTLTQEKEDKMIQMFRNKEVNPNDIHSLAKLLK